MSGPEAFFDTNVVLYLFSADDTKANRAEETIAGGGVVSVQVLNEFANVARRKLAMPWAEIGEILARVREICPVEAIRVETHERGMMLAQRYSLSIYDAMIAASALLAGCSILFTEDMQDGQVIDGSLTIENPFATL